MPSVEYLTISEKSNTFCDSVTTFNKLLQVDSALTISGGVITFKNEFSCNYKITSGEILGKEQRYFHTHFSIDSDSDEELVKFSFFLKTVRTIVSKVGKQTETLWDDVSFFYSKRSYDIIHRTENLMRKLIANFMLITLGVEWVSEAAPSEIKDIINKGKRTDYINVLHNVDFIHLTDFLIKPYSKTSSIDINKLIVSAKNIDDLHEIQAALPESNWSRYFSRLVSCDDSYLQKRWSELYDLRCKVAHNAIISKIDFDRIALLAAELEEKIIDALAKLPQVKVPEHELTSIAEHAAESLSATHGEFISIWRDFEFISLEVLKNTDKKLTTKQLDLKRLKELGFISKDMESYLLVIKSIRNSIVHSSKTTIADEEINKACSFLKHMISVITYGPYYSIDA